MNWANVYSTYIYIYILTSSTPSQCEICASKPAKYTCPSCSMKTCSAACVKQHKIENKCDGARKRSRFVPREELSEQELISDLALLGESYSELERGKRVISLVQEEAAGNSSRTSKKAIRRVVEEAKKRGCTVQLMPESMSKHIRNKSHMDTSTSSILWSVDVHLDDRLVETKHNVSEKTIIRDLLSEITIGDWQHVALEVYKDQPQPIDAGADLLSILNGRTIVEFPALRLRST